MELSVLLKWKAVLFDLDGTLEDTMEAAYKTIENLRAIFGYGTAPSEEVLPVVCEMNHRDAILTYLPEEVKRHGDSQSFAFRYVRWSHERFRKKHARPIPGAIECLFELKDMGIRLALVTNNSEDAVIGYLDKYILHDIFDAHVSGDLGLRKAEAIKFVLAKLEVQEIGNCLYVGDTANDIREGRQAGILAVAVLSGAQSLRLLQAENPFAILNNVSELLTLIKAYSPPRLAK